MFSSSRQWSLDDVMLCLRYLWNGIPTPPKKNTALHLKNNSRRILELAADTRAGISFCLLWVTSLWSGLYVVFSRVDPDTAQVFHNPYPKLLPSSFINRKNDTTDVHSGSYCPIDKSVQSDVCRVPLVRLASRNCYALYSHMPVLPIQGMSWSHTWVPVLGIYEINIYISQHGLSFSCFDTEIFSQPKFLFDTLVCKLCSSAEIMFW